MSIRVATLAGTTLLLAACVCWPTGTAKPTAGAHVEPGAMNVLSAPEKMAGWRMLFNGTDLSGWRGYKKDAPGATWAVQDGTLTLTAGGAGDIMTTEEFGPFELSLEWKIAPKGNSGIIYLIKEVADAPNTYNTGPEMQVLDDDGHADGKTPSHRAGALYDIETPPAGATNPVGRWNLALVRFTGNTIEHYLNGRLVAWSSYGDDAWRAKVAASKFRDMPFGRASTGHIALQDHGDRVWYRNIKIRPL